MDDLVRWLGEQLAEDERIACGADPGPWKSESLGRHDQAAIKLAALTSLIQFDGSRAAANGMHAARHDPARVLREIEAKRGLLALHSPSEFGTWVGDDDDQEPACRVCGNLTVRFPCKTLRLLALPYEGRDGYQEAWRP